ncbi:hypothetical protein K466DRAFT_267617 [Polyporus arcularius HHB13444]|uniref:Uncharacterized protein n=1 Tax=Polyporus arcularius HHB13444 TaxID=1314778 RepID=A0A5C3P0X9_9APHY|nr:hypothetical protein K466DRAFT_267617 [Polyporus arcularius HHB13444]
MSTNTSKEGKRTSDEFRPTNDTTSIAEGQVDEHLEPPAKQRKTEANDQYLEAHRDEDDLLALLDFTQLDTQTAISARFSEIADLLLHHYRVEIKTPSKIDQLELLEIEFYLYKPGCHEDPFTHGSAEQCQAGRWYFHRPPSRSNELGTPTAFTSGYRGGTRKGLDITIGHPAPAVTSKYFSDLDSTSADGSPSSSTSTLRGGILLRSIRRLSDKKVISGSSLLVDEILRLSGASTIPELITDVWQNDISAFALPSSSRRSTMRIVRVSPSPADASGTAPAKPRIYRSPRIGLDLSHPSITSSNLRTHPRVLFVGQPYRFFAHPHLLTANGRGQTFLGVYDAEEAASTHATDSLERLEAIEEITGWKAFTVKNCFAEYRAGMEGSCDRGKPVERVLQKWLGARGRDVGGSVKGWLRMMGTLRRFLSESERKAEDAGAVGAGHK